MEKKAEIYRGKTKAVFATEKENLVVLENFDALTKFDTPELTAQMADKAKYATQTTCNVFRLLEAAGIPVAFRKQLSETEFLADKCQMIPLEVIIRRYAVGSYLNRAPHLKSIAGENPYLFDRLVFELFLKTTGKIIKSFDGREIGKVSVDDPLIEVTEDGAIWKLCHPKIPQKEEGADLMVSVHPTDILPDSEGWNIISRIEEITRRTFLALEGAWSQLGMRLIDFKIEFGMTTDGRLVVSDVIDNDSWRLRTNKWEEVSKQLFRDNADMAEISNKYALVAELTEKFGHFLTEVIVYMTDEYEYELDLEKLDE